MAVSLPPLPQSPLTKGWLFNVFHLEGLFSDGTVSKGVEVLKVHTNLPDEVLEELVRRNLKNLKAMWSKANRTRANFETRFKEWMAEPLDISVIDDPMEGTSSGYSLGRPPLSPAQFTRCSSDTRRRSVKDLLEMGFTGAQFAYAAQMQLRKEGRLHEADIIKRLLTPDGPDPLLVRDSIQRPPPELPRKLSVDEGLALLYSTDVSRDSYLSRDCPSRRGAEVQLAWGA